MNRFLLWIVLFACPLFAQDHWDALKQLKPGDRIEIHSRDRGRIRAEFLNLSPDAIAIRTSAGEQSFAKPDIRKVGLRSGSKRLRKGIIGAAVGGAAGAIGGSVLRVRFENESGPCAECVAIPTLALAGLGALAGLPAAYATVYKAP